MIRNELSQFANVGDSQQQQQQDLAIRQAILTQAGYTDVS
jgi:hypothetical protein